VALTPLLDWLAIPSVSADPLHATDVVRAADWLCARFDGLPGAEVAVTRLDAGTHPSVVGRVAASAGRDDAPTVAVYGHFDVQPAGERSEWSSDPFVPEERDGRLYARGAADSKGNSFAVVEAIERLASVGSLPVHLTLLFDGEEEINGMAIPELAAAQAAPDAALICDGALWDERTPSLAVSLRGTLYYRITVRTGERELHSGSFGGAAMNASHVLIDCLRAVRALDLGAGGPAPGAIASLHDGAALLARAGAQPADPTAAAEFYRRTVCRSAIDVNSMAAGEVTLRKTAIAERATADISVRIAPGDDLDDLDARFRQRLADHVPPGARVDADLLDAVPAGTVDPRSPAIKLASDAFARVFGRAPLLVGGGGTLALFSTFAARGVPVIATGFADPASPVHAADEYIPTRNVTLAIDAVSELFTSLGALRA
jgi:acetylornithine deacetylase/succinyl-diaminopimelate desuccinylase-like protein